MVWWWRQGCAGALASRMAARTSARVSVASRSSAMSSGAKGMAWAALASGSAPPETKLGATGGWPLLGRAEEEQRLLDDSTGQQHYDGQRAQRMI